MTREQFKLRWESDSEGGGINFDDIADCAKSWGIAGTPRIRPIDQILYLVLKAADVKDVEEYKPIN